MADTTINNWDYMLEDDPGESILDCMRNMYERMIEFQELEAQRMKDPDWRYEEVWLIHPDNVDKLPEYPTFLDYVEVGAIFQGWQWVHTPEKQDDKGG